MNPLGFLLSPAGRLRQRPFIVAALAVYALGALSHLLTSGSTVARAGLWPFLAVQIVLVWIWFALHAKRLRDAGHGAGLAAAAAVLYVLSIALLVIVVGMFYGALSAPGPDANTASSLGLIMVASVIAILLGSPQYDLAWLMVAVLLLIAMAPLALALGTTLWAATRPTAG